MANSMDIKLDYSDEKIIPDIDKSLKRIQEIAADTSDLLINEIEVSGVKSALICCEGMLSTSTITNLILLPLTRISLDNPTPEALYEHVFNKLLLSVDRIKLNDYGKLFRTLNSGFAIFIADGMDSGFAFGVQGYSTRGISEPSSEQNIMGAHEGFVEVVRTNMSLIRRRLKSPFLKMELFIRGEKSHTDLCLCYMTDRVPKKLLKEIKASIMEMELETILSTGYVRPFLEEKSGRIFNSVGVTERPDVLCSKLLEGRVALFVDGTPFALVIPRLFTESFQTMDDYAFKPYYAAFIRWLKYAAFFVSILLTGVYAAITIHHPELLNHTLLLILAEAEENAPFSLLAEAVGVLLMYEIIREAGLRLPQGVGGAVSIVSGLIIGDAAVDSGLISTPLLTVVALTVVSGFVLPDLNQQITVLRFLFLLCGGFWGLYGISLLGSVVLFNICATEDYGFPFTAPLSPFYKGSMRDIITRVGFRKMQSGGFTVERFKER